MNIPITREQAIELLKKYNKDKSDFIHFYAKYQQCDKMQNCHIEVPLNKHRDVCCSMRINILITFFSIYIN